MNTLGKKPFQHHPHHAPPPETTDLSAIAPQPLLILGFRRWMAEAKARASEGGRKSSLRSVGIRWEKWCVEREFTSLKIRISPSTYWIKDDWRVKENRLFSYQLLIWILTINNSDSSRIGITTAGSLSHRVQHGKALSRHSLTMGHSNQRSLHCIIIASLWAPFGQCPPKPMWGVGSTLRYSIMSVKCPNSPRTLVDFHSKPWPRLRWSTLIHLRVPAWPQRDTASGAAHHTATSSVGTKPLLSCCRGAQRLSCGWTERKVTWNNQCSVEHDIQS